MSAAAAINANEVTILINGESPRNKLVYIEKQASTGDPVLCHLSIKNKTFIEWEKLKEPDQNYFDILNSHIPGDAFKVDNSCLRLQSRLKAEVSKAKAQLKKLNRGGSKQQVVS